MSEERVTKDNEIVNDEMEDWNDDMIEEMAQSGKSPDFSPLVVYSRDWTVETMYNQIKQGNIDLYPKFQRQHAWNDDKKTRLIESLITGMPVPEIVLAEDFEKERSFIVIDGKQRLLTIAGFIDPEKYEYWKKPALKKKQLTINPGLGGLTFDQMKNKPSYEAEYRRFLNADVRCTVVSNCRSWDVLYNIFYRLNIGSVLLSSQELRQVLSRGPFADYLMEITSESRPIHRVLKCNVPDDRLRDAEMILRFMAFVMFSEEYDGKLQRFLDEKMKYVTKNWEQYSGEVQGIYSDFNRAIEKLEKILGSESVGRIYPPGKWGGRFNKVLFEVEAYYFTRLQDKDINGKEELFKAELEKFCGENALFRESIRTSTSDLERYANRYQLFCDFINQTFETNIPVLPLPKK